MKYKFILLILLISICINVNAVIEPLEVLVGDQWLNETNTIITDGDDGRAILDVDTNTLTLENFDYTGKGIYIEDLVGDYCDFYSALGVISDSLTINLKGTNTFNYQSVGEEGAYQLFAFFGGDATISGSGKLILTSSGTGDEASTVVGISSAGKLNVRDTNLTINVGYGDMVDIVHGCGDVNFISSNVDLEFTGSANFNFFGIYAGNKIIINNCILKLSAYSLDSEAFNIGLNSNEKILISYSSLYIRFNSANDESYVFFCDDIEIRNTIVDINTDSSVFGTEDSLILDSCACTIKTQAKLLDYDRKSPTGNVTSGMSSVKVSDDYYLTNPLVDFGDNEITALGDVKYLETTVDTVNGSINYSLNKNGVKVLTNDIANNMTLSNLDDFNRGFDLDMVIFLEVSNDYDKTDDVIIENNLGDYTLGKTMNISLGKYIGLSGEAAYITELNNKIKLSIELPTELIKNNRSYKVMNIHECEPILLDATFNKTNNTLEFETNKFSTYAILYSDSINNPQTGDNLNYYITLITLSLMGLVITLNLKRKYNYKKRI